MLKICRIMFLCLPAVSALAMFAASVIPFVPVDFDLWYLEKVAENFHQRTQLFTFVTEAPDMNALDQKFLEERTGGVSAQAVEFTLVRKERKIIAWFYGRLGVDLENLPQKDLGKPPSLYSLGQPLEGVFPMGKRHLIDLPETQPGPAAPDQGDFEVQYEHFVHDLDNDRIVNPAIKFHQPEIYTAVADISRVALILFPMSLFGLLFLAMTGKIRRTAEKRRKDFASKSAAECQLQKEIEQADMQLRALLDQCPKGLPSTPRVKEILDLGDSGKALEQKRRLAAVLQKTLGQRQARRRDEEAEARHRQQFRQAVQRFFILGGRNPDPEARDSYLKAVACDSHLRRMKFVDAACGLQEQANERDQESRHKKARIRVRA